MPSRLPRASHIVRVGTKDVVVKLPDVYSANGSDIGTYVGVTKVTGSVSADTSNGRVSNLLLDAQIARIRISYRNAAGKYRTADIICDLDKYKSAIGTLPGKNYRGSKIIDAFIGRRRRLG